MLSYLEVTGDDSSVDKSSCDGQKSAKESLASQSNGSIREKVFCNRLDESKAIVEMDWGLQPDRRTEQHWNQMERLYEIFKDARKPFSLDQYFHQDLTNHEVKERVSSQVVSRFIYYQHCSATHSREKESTIASNVSRGQERVLHNRFRNLNLNPRQLFKREPERDVESSPQGSLVHVPQVNPDSDSESDPDSEPVGEPLGGRQVNIDSKPESNTDSNRERRKVQSVMKDILKRKRDPPWQQILIVPQLWLFTVDSRFSATTIYTFTTSPDCAGIETCRLADPPRHRLHVIS